MKLIRKEKKHVHTDFEKAFATWVVKESKLNFSSFQTENLYERDIEEK